MGIREHGKRGDGAGSPSGKRGEGGLGRGDSHWARRGGAAVGKGRSVTTGLGDVT